MAIRIVKKVDASTEKIFPKRKTTSTAETVQNWVTDLRSKKLKERAEAEKFWGIGAFAK